MLKPEQLDDEAVMALLDAHAVELGGKLAVERIDGRWRAGFVVPDDVGESVIALPAEGLHPSAARRELLIRAAEALDMSAHLAIRTAEALEMSANVAEHEAARLELAGRSDDAARERHAADRALQASQRARSHGSGIARTRLG